MLFLQFKVLNTLYPIILQDNLSITWATFYVGVFLFVIILTRDADSGLLDCESTTQSDHKELYIGVYTTWFVSLLAAFYFPKHIRFPIPILTELFHKLKLTNTKPFHILTFIIQSLAIWIMCCLIQLMTLHGIFFLVALLAKPVTVLTSLAYVFTFIALAISGTSVMLEVVSLQRTNPLRVKKALHSYKRDLLNIQTSILLPVIIIGLIFLSYQFADKLGSTLDLTGTPAAIVAITHSIVLFVLSIALRKRKFRQIFDEVKDNNAHKFLYDDAVPLDNYSYTNADDQN